MFPKDGFRDLPADPEEQTPKPVSKKRAALRTVPWKDRPLWMRMAAWAFGSLFALLVLLLTFRDVMVLQLVRRFGGAITGTKVELRNFQTSLTGLSVAVHGFSITSPPGYHTPKILELERLYISFKTRSLFSDMVVVENAELRGLHINYEQKYSGNNLADLQENIDDFVDSHGGYEDEASAKDAPPGKSLLIRHLEISGNSITVTNTETGQTVTLPMVNIVMENIGGPGCEVSDVLNEVYEKVTNLVMGTLSNVGGQFSVMSASTADKIKDAGNAALESISNGGKKTWQGMQNAGNSVVEGTKKTGSMIKSLWK